MRHAREKLAAIRKLPEHGLIIFAAEDVCEVLAPPMPVKSSYVCDKHFAIDELRPLFKPAQEQCFLTFCPREVIFWKTVGTRRVVLDRIDVELHTDSARGGQSAPRFGRIRQGQRQALLKQIGEVARRLFHSVPVVAGSGELVAEYCRLAGSTEPVRIAATEHNAAMQETLVKAAPVLANQEIAEYARNQALFEDRLARGAAFLFGDEIREAADQATLKMVFSDGSVDCEFAPSVVRVLDLTAYGGLVGVPYF